MKHRESKGRLLVVPFFSGLPIKSKPRVVRPKRTIYLNDEQQVRLLAALEFYKTGEDDDVEIDKICDQIIKKVEKL